MRADHLERNLALLERSDPAAAAAIGAATPSPRSALVASRKGPPTLQLQLEDERTLLLHSRIDPEREGESLAADHRLGPSDCGLVLGFGLGYHALSLAREAPRGASLVIVEPHVGRLRQAFEANDLAPLLERSEVTWVIAPDPQAVHAHLRTLTQRLFFGGLRLVRHGPSMQADAEWFDQVLALVSELREEALVQFRTNLFLARTSMENRLGNLRRYAQSPGIEHLNGVARGWPAVVVSSGPSLAGNVDQLLDLQDRAIIVATSSSLKTLLAHGVKPHFTVVIDHSALSRKFFEGLPPDFDVPLLCDSKANFEAVAAWPGPTLFGADPFLDAIIGADSPLARPRGKLPAGSTVAECAWRLTQVLGADPVVMVGQDLAYPWLVTHAPGSAFFDAACGNTNRFAPFETLEAMFIIRERSSLVKIPGSHQREVLSTRLWLSYLRNLEAAFEQAKGVTIDATEGGARLRGAEPISLEAVAAGHCSRPLPPDLSRACLRSPPDQDHGTPAATTGALQAMLSQRLIQLDDLLPALKQLETTLETTAEATSQQRPPGSELIAQVRRHKQAAMEKPAFRELFNVFKAAALADDMARERADRLIDTREVDAETLSLTAQRDLDFVAAIAKAVRLVRDRLAREADMIAALGQAEERP